MGVMKFRRIWRYLYGQSSLSPRQISHPGRWKLAKLAVFIESCGSACVMATLCEVFFFLIDGAGNPVLVPTGVSESLSGERIDPVECGGHIRRRVFESVYRRELLWLCESPMSVVFITRPPRRCARRGVIRLMPLCVVTHHRGSPHYRSAPSYSHR